MPDKPKTTAQIEVERHVLVAEAIGEPDPIPEPVKAKPDTRNAIQIERDEQKAVEKAVHNITIVEPQA